MREQEMAINVAKQIYFDNIENFYKIADERNENASANDLFNEAETFRQITKQFILRAKTICSYTREKLNEVRVICIYRGLEEEGYISDTQFIEYLKYTDKIIDEILKQVVVLGGEQNSRTKEKPTKWVYTR